jgi:hypothetical protein
MKTLRVIILSCFTVLLLSSFVQGQTRYVGTYDGGYLVGSDHAVSEMEEPCPENTHICVHTYRKYGPGGVVHEHTRKHCIPNARPYHGNAYGHGNYYEEREYVYEPQVRVYRPRYYVYQPPVVVRPPVVYHTPSYYGNYYGDRVVGDTLVGGAFGAAAGAAIGAVVGSPGDGAAIGAVIGGLNALSHGVLGHGFLR